MIIWKRNKQNDELTNLRNEKKYWNKQYCEQAEHIESLRNQLEIKTRECDKLNKMLEEDNLLKEQLYYIIADIETFLDKNKYSPEDDLTDWQEITNIHYQNLLFKQRIYKIGKALFNLLNGKKEEN